MAANHDASLGDFLLIDFSNFHVLDPDARHTAQELVDGGRGRSPFLPFLHTWMGFNGWMEAITSATTDREMIDALADNRRSTDAYQRLLNHNDEFRQAVDDFARLFPVLDLRDIRKKLGRDAFARYANAELLALCDEKDVKKSPDGWIRGDTPTWPQTLRTIYKIRCNLFHGGKSPSRNRDRDLVQRAHQVLHGYIESSRCFDWGRD